MVSSIHPLTASATTVATDTPTTARRCHPVLQFLVVILYAVCGRRPAGNHAYATPPPRAWPQAACALLCSGRGSGAYSHAPSSLESNTRHSLIGFSPLQWRSPKRCGTQECLCCLEACMKISLRRLSGVKLLEGMDTSSWCRGCLGPSNRKGRS